MTATYKSVYYHKIVLFFCKLTQVCFCARRWISKYSFVFEDSLEKISTAVCNAA